MEFQFWSKCTVDVIYEDKKIRFYGELGGNGAFYACASTMRWMEPKLDKPVTEEEIVEWMQLINENQDLPQYAIIFTDIAGNIIMLPQERIKRQKRMNTLHKIREMVGTVFMFLTFILMIWIFVYVFHG